MQLLYVRPADRSPDSYCWCGWSLSEAKYDTRAHNLHHHMMEWGEQPGILAVRGGIAPDGYSIIPCIAKTYGREKVHRLMRGFRMYMGFDFVQWPSQRATQNQAVWADEQLTAIVQTACETTKPTYRVSVIDAWMILHKQDRCWRVAVEDQHTLSPEYGEERSVWSIAAIYVTPGWEIGGWRLSVRGRREGRGRRLVEQAAKYAGVDAHDLAWGLPLSAEGWAFATGLSDGKTINVSA